MNNAYGKVSDYDSVCISSELNLESAKVQELCSQNINTNNENLYDVFNNNVKDFALSKL